MVSFASPERLWWLLAAIPIIALYCIRTRRRTYQVSGLQFWDRITTTQRSTTWGGRPRSIASLLLQLLILTTIVVAAADPYPAGGRQPPAQRVLVLDVSASMRAGDRWEAAKRQALQLLQNAPMETSVGCIAAAERPLLVMGMTDDRRAIVRAIETLQPTDVAANLPAAVQAAGRWLPDPDDANASIDLISDGCGTIPETTGVANTRRLRVHRVGRPINNVALTHFQLRRQPNDPQRIQIQLAAQAFFTEAARADEPKIQGRIVLTQNDQPFDVVPCRFTPSDRWQRTLRAAAPAAGTWTAQLELDDAEAFDAWQRDNRRQAILTAAPAPTIHLLAPRQSPASYLTYALQAIDAVEVQRFVNPADDRPPDVTVLYKTLPNPLPTGPLLVIDPPTDALGWRLGPPRFEQTIAEPAMREPASQTRARHPILRHVDAAGTLLAEVRSLQLPPSATPLLRTLDGQIIMAAIERPAASQRPARRIVVLTGDPERSELPRRVAFPILLTNAIRWLTDTSERWQPATIAGQRHAAEAPVIRRAGIARPTSARRSLPIATQLNPSESDLLPAEATSSTPKPPSDRPHRRWWRRLALLAIVGVVLEWSLYQRRLVD